MSTRRSPWPPGTPCWTDLTVPDLAAARAFYAAVLGWEFVETGEDFGGYVIAHVGDSPAAGIGPQQPGVPPAWTLYLASADADATAAAVTEHGGTVVLEPGDVGPLGRMLLAADPSGAVFGVWQAGSHIGAGVVNEPGGLTWEDLRSTDPDAARAFYSNVFGHHHEPLPQAPPDYLTFAAAPGEPPLGGMGGMMGADGAPSHWLVYFAVADADGCVAAALAQGGSVLAPAFDTPFGRMAGLTDPAGASFFVAQTGGAGDPDRSG